MKPCSDISVPQRMDHSDFDVVSSTIAPPGGSQLWSGVKFLNNCWMDCSLTPPHSLSNSLYYLSSATIWSKCFQNYTFLIATFYSWHYEHVSRLSMYQHFDQNTTVRVNHILAALHNMFLHNHVIKTRQVTS